MTTPVIADARTSTLDLELPLDRRGFLAGLGGLVVALGAMVSPREALAGGPATVGAYVQIGTDETVTVFIGSTEMGQGIMTGLAQVVADELKVDWSQVRGAHGPATQNFANPMFGFQLTGGSTSMRGWYLPLRKAAAAAREMLLTAGANALGVDRSLCTVAHGRVVFGSRSVTFGAVAAAAGRLTPPANPPLLRNRDRRFVGRTMPRLDIPAKVDGSAVFGLDVRVPGMVYAVIRHAPRFGGTLVGVPPVPAGAIAVVPLGNAVAVVAVDTWRAMNAARELQAKWTTPADAADLGTTAVRAKAATLLASGEAMIAENVGDALAGVAAGAVKIDAVYELPYAAHACMEPLNCTAKVDASGCEIWAPTQGQGSAVYTAIAATGLPADKIRINTTFLGGGLGRKFEQDFIRQAILTAKAIGKPVKLTWSREEDFGNDQYRPMALIRVRAGADRAGHVTGFHVRGTSPSIAAQRRAGFNGVDSSAVEGSVDLSYRIEAHASEWVRHPSKIPVGYWRSVGHSINAFAVESAIDELATAAGIDPLAFRLGLLTEDPRGAAVLTAAATLGGWATRVAAGRARGLAYHESFGSRVAQVVEISAPVAGAIVVHKVAVAIDCGKVVNPGQVEAQMQGCVVHGLTAALWSEMTFTGGKADQRNFNRYRMMRLREMPVVSVKVIAGGDPIGGVGEPGVPPIAPALANAYAKLTGQRLRRLPFFPGTSGGEDDD